jgi:hypothetical protein
MKSLLRWRLGLSSKFENASSLPPPFMHFFTTQHGNTLCGLVKMYMHTPITIYMFAGSNVPYPYWLQPQTTKRTIFDPYTSWFIRVIIFNKIGWQWNTRISNQTFVEFL